MFLCNLTVDPVVAEMSDAFVTASRAVIRVG